VQIVLFRPVYRANDPGRSSLISGIVCSLSVTTAQINGCGKRPALQTVWCCGPA